MYSIEIVPSAARELRAVPPYHRKLIEVAVEKKLAHEPGRSTKNRKCLKNFIPSFGHVQPVWELRIEDWRVFYDIDEANETIIIRAIRKKARGHTTGDIA